MRSFLFSFFSHNRLLIDALLCGSCVGVLADPSPTYSRPLSPIPPLVHPVPPAPLKLPASLTNLSISFANVARGESVKLLDAKVSFKVKNASFLSVLDVVLASAGTTCNVEVRGLKAMRLSLDLKDAPAGPLLDALAKTGGARLWVFATKVLIAPESLLTQDEKKEAKLYGVLATASPLSAGGALSMSSKGIDFLNAKISVDLNAVAWDRAWGAMALPKAGRIIDFGYPDSMMTGQTSMPVVSASFQDISMGDAIASIAHASGFEVYIMPDDKKYAHLVICPPDDPALQNKAQAVPIFTASSTHFNFGPNSNLDPSAKGS